MRMLRHYAVEGDELDVVHNIHIHINVVCVMFVQVVVAGIARFHAYGIVWSVGDTLIVRSEGVTVHRTAIVIVSNCIERYTERCSCHRSSRAVAGYI